MAEVALSATREQLKAAKESALAAAAAGVSYSKSMHALASESTS